jgi:hypothetical protein
VKVNDAVREEIIDQFGGYRLIQCMLGGRVTYIESGIRIDWPNKQRSKGNRFEIELYPDDTYTVTFYNATKRSIKMVQFYTGVYCDQLQDIFETHTGWRLDVPMVRQVVRAY